MRRLALARVRELRAQGWSYRQIGRETCHAGPGPVQQAFLQLLDLMSEGLALFDGAGMLLHSNAPLKRALEGAGERDRLQDEILTFARRLAAPASPAVERREIHTAAGSYHLRGGCVATGLFGSGGVVLVALELPEDLPPGDETLRERFGLTPRECRIARLIAGGRSNAQVAAELEISPHTARRHTERIFAKLGIRTRAEVGQRLHGNASLGVQSATRIPR